MEKQAHSQPRRLLAFDFGLKRIGVAIGQTLTYEARPLTTLAAKAGVPEIKSVSQLIQHWQPDALVVGVPLNMDGSDQPMSQKARDFAAMLRTTFHLPTYETDERLTTKAAREYLFETGGYRALQDGQVDQVAAQLILQHWFSEQSR